LRAKQARNRELNGSGQKPGETKTKAPKQNPSYNIAHQSGLTTGVTDIMAV